MNTYTEVKPVKEKAVVIFGCGYLGEALAVRLQREGYRVHALTRNPETAGRLRELGLERVVEAELQSESWHRELDADYGSWVNCVSSAGGGLAGYETSYVQGMASILRWMTRSGQTPEVAVYTSSTSVYPQHGGVWVDETADCAGAPPTGEVLLRSEALFLGLAPAVRAFVFRLAGIYGPGRTYLLDQLRSGAGELPGSGEHHLNLIHRDDAVAAILRALGATESAGGIFNLADDAPHRKAAVLEWLAERLGVPAPRFAPEVVNPRLARRGGVMPDRRISNRRARESLPWAPAYPSFKEGYDPLFRRD